MKAIGYARSTTENGTALERQRTEIEEYCRSRGWEFSALYSDNGRSGMDMGRTGLTKALDELGKGYALIATSADRLTRSIGQLAELVGVVRGKGAELIILYAPMKLSSALRR